MNLAAMDNLSELKAQLKIEFANAFDQDAYNKFYFGQYFEDGKKHENPEAFNHQLVESQKGLEPQIKFLTWHQYMGLIWQLSALEKTGIAKTTNIYREAKSKLMEGFKAMAMKQLPTGTEQTQKLSKERLQKIIDLLEDSATNVAIQYGYTSPSTTPALVEVAKSDNDGHAPIPKAA